MIAIEKIAKVCSCGTSFKTTPKRISSGRGKFCSTKCARSKPVPEAQKLVQRQKMLGRHSSPNTQFKKGQTPWNKDIAWIEIREEKHYRWRGNDVGYYGLHDWVEKELGKPNKCEHCNKEGGRMEWANKSHEYKRVTSDWIRLCKKCHIKYDRQLGDWGVATRRFAL